MFRLNFLFLTTKTGSHEWKKNVHSARTLIRLTVAFPRAVFLKHAKKSPDVLGNVTLVLRAFILAGAAHAQWSRTSLVYERLSHSAIKSDALITTENSVLWSP